MFSFSKKSLTWWLLLLISATAIGYAFQATQPSQTLHAAQEAPAAPPPPISPVSPLSNPLTTSSTGSPYSFGFNTSDLAALIDGGATDDDDWRVFVNFGDGTFWMGTKADFDGRSFVFEGTPTGGYAELTPTYDDGDKNPGRAAMPAVTPSTTSPNQRDVVFASGKAVKLQSNRSPRKDNIITYIISYKNNRACTVNGDLIFRYDPEVLRLEDNNSILGNSITVHSSSATTTNNTGLIHLNFTGLGAGSQRNVFLHFVTQSGVSTSMSYTKPSVEYESSSEGPASCEKEQDTDSMSAEAIVDSHDPNYKFGQEEFLHPAADSVTFTISFQNEGPGPTQTVKVYDELDPFLVAQEPRLLSWSTANVPAVNITGRMVEFDFGSLQVRGLGEPDYGITFGEDATMETFTFRCAIKKQTPLNINPKPNTVRYSPCNAICNKAQVVFDCNPPYPTNMVIVPIRCGPTPPPPPPSPSSPAPANIGFFCSELRDTLNFDTLVLDSFLLSASQLSTLQNTLGGVANYRFKWYPSENFVDPFALNPVLKSQLANKPTAHQLVLVASKETPACQRHIVHVNLPSPCKMQIQVQPQFTGGGGCTSNQATNLVASVTGVDAAAQPLLQWHLCQVVGPTCTKPISQYQNKYYFGVTDPTTGCTAEVVYTYPKPGGGSSGPWSAQQRLAAAALVILIGALLYAIFRKR